ncbi:MAG: GIDE domain-containing protein, partial [Halobacteria archaeon]|nr:GIDE domain-containing protein [Halobacteria archaeon]
TLRAPLSGTECVVYIYEEQVYRQSSGSDDSSGWDTVDKDSASVPFYLDDGTGEVLIDSDRADYEVDEDNVVKVNTGMTTSIRLRITDWVKRLVGLKDKSPGKKNEKLKNINDERLEQLRSGGRPTVYTESYIAVGEEVIVYGTVLRKGMQQDSYIGEIKSIKRKIGRLWKTTPSDGFGTDRGLREVNVEGMDTEKIRRAFEDMNPEEMKGKSPEEVSRIMRKKINSEELPEGFRRIIRQMEDIGQDENNKPKSGFSIMKDMMWEMVDDQDLQGDDIIVSRNRSNPNFVISDKSEKSLYRGKITKSLGMVLIGAGCLVGALYIVMSNLGVI